MNSQYLIQRKSLTTKDQRNVNILVVREQYPVFNFEDIDTRSGLASTSSFRCSQLSKMFKKNLCLILLLVFRECRD